MKQFFNVLYRRILYRIPLKWLLVLLVVFALGIASFSDADDITLYDGLEGTYDGINSFLNPLYNTQDTDVYLMCITNLSQTDLHVWQGVHEVIVYHGNYYPSCIGVDTNIGGIYIDGGGQDYSVYNVLYMKASDFSSINCQTTYNLIPISSVDSNYCTTNNLCPSCPSCPVGTGGISNVYINDILHVGASNIFMNIAEEIDWDYAYTQGGNNMNIDIVGYNVDYEKMQEQIDIQNFKPDSSDLSTIISEIIPLFVPGLCIILLLYFIFRFIKKIF